MNKSGRGPTKQEQSNEESNSESLQHPPKRLKVNKSVILNNLGCPLLPTQSMGRCMSQTNHCYNSNILLYSFAFDQSVLQIVCSMLRLSTFHASCCAFCRAFCHVHARRVCIIFHCALSLRGLLLSFARLYFCLLSPSCRLHRYRGRRLHRSLDCSCQRYKLNSLSIYFFCYLCFRFPLRKYSSSSLCLSFLAVDSLALAPNVG